MMLKINIDQSIFENIKASLEDYFKDWEIKFPDELFEFSQVGEYMSNRGWSIQYSIDFDLEKNPIFYVAADHRMTNPRRFKILHDGSMDDLNYIQEFFSYDPKIEGDKEKKEKEYYIQNRSAGAEHRLFGIDSYDLQGLTKVSDLYKSIEGDPIFVESPESILHPDYKVKIRYKGRDFESVSHCYHFYKASVLGDMDEKKSIELAKKYDFESTYQLETFLKEDSNKHTFVDSHKAWQNLREELILEINLHKFFYHQSLRNEMLKNVRKEIIYNSALGFWGNNQSNTKNNRLGINLAYVCYLLYYLQDKPSELL